MVAREDEELNGLLDAFVCVRVVQMGGVDLGTFQFDPLVSWSVFLMNADKTIYGRFGTASPQANRNKSDSNPNHTVAGLKAALRRALQIHRLYGKMRKDWTSRLAGKTGTPPPWRHAETSPAARKYKRLKRVKGDDTAGCVHCHEILRTQIDSYFMTKRKLPDSMLWVYPHPEILGLTLSKDHCAQVTAVASASQAEKAGFRAEDTIEFAAGQPLLSVADLQWVLHSFADDGGRLRFEVGRAEESLTLNVQLPSRWKRKGDFGWRYRVAGYAMWLWGGVTLEDTPAGPRVTHRSPGWFKRPNREARKALQVGDVILAVDGTPGWTRSTYIAYLMREKSPGARVELRVRRRDKGEIDLHFRVPKPRPEVQGY